jgi:hypothetical protein
VVVDSVFIPESVSAVVEIDVVSSAVIDAEIDASSIGVSLCSDVDVDVDVDEVETEDEESESSAGEVEVVVEESLVLSSAVATSPARAGKIDKSLSAHATYTP